MRCINRFIYPILRLMKNNIYAASAPIDWTKDD